ncbi:MAG TPA: CPBP family intramembrane glutamic endopeptidase [Rubrobacter sp.]|nr:CPBP family intramembrane glutamic endopeptidase [Rubrobacter sp.]
MDSRPRPGTSASLRLRLLGSPLIRVILATVVVFVAVLLAQSFAHLFRDIVPASLYYLLYVIASVLVACFAYVAYVRVVERRTVSELSTEGAVQELGAGVAIGAGLVIVVVAALWVLGYYAVVGTNAGTVLLIAFANDASGAVVEEILFRAIVFRISEEALGTWLALLVSILLFGLVHIGEPGAIPVALAASLLLCCAYMLTRRLWLPIGIHFAWDFTQDGVFGVGAGVKGLMQAELTGPSPLSGGETGIEASALALVAVLVAGLYLLLRASRQRKLVEPPWRRRTLPSRP